MPPGHPYLSRLSQVVRWGLHPHLFFPVSDLMPKPCQGLSLSVRPPPPRAYPMLARAAANGSGLWRYALGVGGDVPVSRHWADMDVHL